MELNEYLKEVLTVLKKNTELESVMSTIAEDSALIPVKGTIMDIEKRVVKDRIIELTEAYFGKTNHVGVEKKKKRWAFTKGIGDTATQPQPTRAQLREGKKAEMMLKKKKKLEAELAAINKNE